MTAILSFPIGTALAAAAKLSGSFRLTAFLNLFDLMKPGTKLFDNNSSLAIEFPLTITRELVDKMVKKQEEDNNFHSFYL